jgi:hypothetical protein
MMDYFEVRQRLTNLTEFRRLYIEYLDFTNRFENPAAEIVLKKMERLLPMTVQSLRQTGLGGMITRDAPVHGGRRVRINLIKAIFRPHLIKRFNLDDNGPLEILDRGVMKYQRLLWMQKVQLFNPVFWIYQFGVFLARLPFHIARASGFSTDSAERLGIVKLYLFVFQIAYFFVLFKALGLFEWVRIDFIAL